jgi:hypothetical protein
MDKIASILIDSFAKSPSESAGHPERMRRISFFQQVVRSFAEFTMSQKPRSFALLRMTDEGLRMTSARLKMTVWDFLLGG